MTHDLTARYAKAEALLPYKMKKLVDTPRVNPVWIRDTESFWYRNTTASDSEFVLVDAEAGTKQPAFDHVRLAEAVGKVLDKELDPRNLPFFGIELIDGVVRFVIDGMRLEVDLDTYETSILGASRPAEATSPDGRWAVGVRDHNLYLREVASNEVRQLTTDGEEGHAYGGMNDAVAARVMQGFAHGGESATAYSYVSEIAPPNRRGMWGSVAFIAIFGGSAEAASAAAAGAIAGTYRATAIYGRVRDTDAMRDVEVGDTLGPRRSGCAAQLRSDAGIRIGGQPVVARARESVRSGEANALAGWAESHAIDLTVIGAYERSRLFHYLVGGQGPRILEAVRSDVLLVRPGRAN